MKNNSIDDELLASLSAPELKLPQKTVRDDVPDPLTRTTISIRKSECRLADDILTVLRENDIRASFSDAVKIALRLCPGDESKIIAAFKDARAGDQRGRSRQNTGL